MIAVDGEVLDQDRGFTGKVGKTYTLTLWRFGERIRDITKAISYDTSVCTLKVNSDDTIKLTTKGVGNAGLGFEFISGSKQVELEDGTLETVYQTTKTNFEWYGTKKDYYEAPGVSVKEFGCYYMDGSHFGNNFSNIYVFDIMYNGVKVNDYTVEGLNGLEYKIQSDGSLLVIHDHKYGNYPFTITHNGVSSSYTLVVWK
jgi:hypothetical protein